MWWVTQLALHYHKQQSDQEGFFKKKKSKYSLMTSILILAIITVCNVHILWAEDVWNNKYIKWVLTASFNAKSQTIKKRKEKKP